MKKIKILIIQLIPLLLFAQSDFYPIQDYYGGGIGYSPTYLSLDSIPGSSLMTKMGLNTNNFNSPFIIHGGEGFTQISGRWRLGGYAGIGSSSISNIMDTYLYKEMNDSLGIQTESDTVGPVISQSTVTAKFSFTLGAVLLEYVVPVFRDLEISGGAMLGIGRVNVSIDQYTGEAKWNDFYSNLYGTVQDGNVYYEIPNDSSFNSNYYDNKLTPVNKSGGLTDLSGTFFNFQPYIAVKWQIMDRVGLRMSLGYNQGTIGAGKWKLNDRKQIADSPKSTLQGLAIRTMFYFGL
ncbi:MAG: hypothetical protein ACE5D0_05515 [Fidelibacterota bacterium]